MDALELQIRSALDRFVTLQRRVGPENGESPKLLERALKELEGALEELQVAQEQLVENRHRMEQMQTVLQKQYERYWELFDLLPEPYVVTDTGSAILEANKAAAELFNVSQRFLVGKTMSVFVCENRSGFLVEAGRVAEEHQATEIAFRLRPRERAPMNVVGRVSGGEGGTLRWIIRAPAAAASAQG